MPSMGGHTRCPLQITGVQSVGVGGRLYTALAPVVVDTRPPPTSTAQEAAPSAARLRVAEAETVVFPRDGASVDQRPDSVRRERAIERYRENGRRPPRRRR
jgi:hypothetical protein